MARAEKEFAEYCRNMEDLLKNEGFMTQSKGELEKYLESRRRTKADLERKVKVQKQEYFKCQQDLHRLKTEKDSLFTEVQGIISMSKNLDSHLHRLHTEIQRQRELLYNADYQIQLLERKVARTMGEKSLEETDYLKEIIREKEAETEIFREKYAATVGALKTLEDEERLVEKRLKTISDEVDKFKTMIDKINLENDMTRQQLSALVGKKKDVMVKNDVMKLEIQKLRSKVLKANEDILVLENKIKQVELEILSRESELEIHQGVLKAKMKCAEQERHRVAKELATRKKKVKNLQIKYKALIQR